MRIFMLAVVAIALGGCSKAGPTLAGGKPVDHWVKALNDPDPRVRKTAVTKLGNVGPTDPAALPALLGALKDQDAGVRCETILALLKFGPDAKSSIPALTEIRRDDPDAKVREYAGKALTKLEPAALR